MTTQLILSLVIFGLTYICIASEKVDKTVAALVGAGLVVALRTAPMEELLSKVDLNVLALLIGMMIIVDILASTGLFEYIAIQIAKRSRGNALLIMVEFLLVTAIFSAFLDNVTTIILIAPITILIAQILEIPAIPLLIMEAIFSNIGGTATLIGDPPNIIIGAQAKIHFNEFIYHLTPVVAVIVVVSLVVTYFMLRKKMRASAANIEQIMKARPDKAIIEPGRLKRSLIVFALVMVGFFTGRLTHIEPGIVAITGAGLMILFSGVSVHKVLEKVEWATILFFVGLFVLVGSLEANGAFEMLGNQIVILTKGNLLLTVIAVLWFAAIVSAIVDNIPLVIAMIPLIKSIIPSFADQFPDLSPEELRAAVELPLYWALALGACFGGNGTLIGASANVVIAQIGRRNKYDISFWRFTKYGFGFMLLSVSISTVYLYWRYF